MPLSSSAANERALTRVRPREGVTKWSWRESNPRPHKETIRFLHAYLGLDFRAVTRPKPPITTLSPKSHPYIGACMNYFRFNLRRWTLRFGTTSLERRPVLSPCKRIKPLIYYTSIRQREHTHCCQLIFLQKRLWSLPQPSSACLRTISSCRQIQSTPDSETMQNAGIAMQRYKKNTNNE